jgi:hypothetical protein
MDLTDILLIAVGGTLWLWLLIWFVRTDPCRQTRGVAEPRREDSNPPRSQSK